MKNSDLFNLITRFVQIMEFHSGDLLCNRCGGTLKEEEPDGSRECVACGDWYPTYKIDEMRIDRLYECWSDLADLAAEAKELISREVRLWS